MPQRHTNIKDRESFCVGDTGEGVTESVQSQGRQAIVPDKLYEQVRGIVE